MEEALGTFLKPDVTHLSASSCPTPTPKLHYCTGNTKQEQRREAPKQPESEMMKHPYLSLVTFRPKWWEANLNSGPDIPPAPRF